MKMPSSLVVACSLALGLPVAAFLIALSMAPDSPPRKAADLSAVEKKEAPDQTGKR